MYCTVLFFSVFVFLTVKRIRLLGKRRYYLCLQTSRIGKERPVLVIPTGRKMHPMPNNTVFLYCKSRKHLINFTANQCFLSTYLQWGNVPLPCLITRGCPEHWMAFLYCKRRNSWLFWAFIFKRKYVAYFDPGVITIDQYFLLGRLTFGVSPSMIIYVDYLYAVYGFDVGQCLGQDSEDPGSNVERRKVRVLGNG